MIRMLYDAHCHLHDARLRPFLPEIIESLREIGIGRVVVNGTREQDWSDVLQLARRHEFVMPSLGIHPWYVKERSSAWVATLEENSPSVIGEIGLDRWMRDYDPAEQESVFIEQLNVAARLNRPVSIHCLKAWGKLLDILSTNPPPGPGFLLHSYGGPAEMISQFAKLGAYFSISGYFAHSRKLNQQEVFRRVPLDRLLVETDAPDMQLPPELIEFSLPDDTLNHPANLRAVYHFTARLRGVSFDDLARAVETNFHSLFGSA